MPARTMPKDEPMTLDQEEKIVGQASYQFRKALRDAKLTKERAQKLALFADRVVPDFSRAITNTLDYVDIIEQFIAGGVTQKIIVGLSFSKREFYFAVGVVSVRDVCKVVGVKAQLVEDIYDYYRAEELGSLPGGATVDFDVTADRRQIITDLFPFPEITWNLGMGAGKRVCNRFSAPDLHAIGRRCQQGKMFLRERRCLMSGD